MDGVVPAREGVLWSGEGVLPRVWACLDLCVGGGDGPNPGHGPRGWPGRWIHWARQIMASPRL